MHRFTATDGFDVYIKLKSIDAIHVVHLLDGGVPKHTGAKIIFASGGFQCVRETVAEVLSALEG